MIHVVHVSPFQGDIRGGTLVDIYGMGFRDPSQLQVRFGNYPCQHIALLSEESLQVRSPPASVGGPVKVSVSIDKGEKWSNEEILYTYIDRTSAKELIDLSMQGDQTQAEKLALSQQPFIY